MSKIGAGTLKCVILSGDTGQALNALGPQVSAENMRQVGEGAILLHTEVAASELRDRLSAVLGEGASALVIEFETWSGYGDAIDRVWLLERGH
ncbi:MAG TPA: hypothetical protein VLS25_00020 [Dehalococcoidia bacterium]|nr:hypothetical protein [Dehalococcoidia bacterium]